MGKLNNCLKKQNMKAFQTFKKYELINLIKGLSEDNLQQILSSHINKNSK